MPSKPEAEALLGGPIDDWQWMFIKNVRSGKVIAPLLYTPRCIGKTAAIERLMETFRGLGYQVKKTDYGWSVNLQGEK